MQNRKTIILGRVQSGGVDLLTLRPLPDRLVDIRMTYAQFESLGLQTQLVAGISQEIYREKILARTAFFDAHDYVYVPSEGRLYRIVTTQAHMEKGQRDNSQIYLIVSSDKTESILRAFEEAIEYED